MHAETFNPLHAAMHADLVALYPLPYALRILPAISSMICSKYVLVEKYISTTGGLEIATMARMRSWTPDI